MNVPMAQQMEDAEMEQRYKIHLVRNSSYRRKRAKWTLFDYVFAIVVCPALALLMAEIFEAFR